VADSVASNCAITATSAINAYTITPSIVTLTP
jgi:hypothetical protein